jgi:hypothetical protein
MAEGKLQRAAWVCEIGDAGLEWGTRVPVPDSCDLADGKATMAHKSHTPDFDQMLEILHAHDFEVQPFAGIQGGFLVSKHGAGAVLVAAEGKDVPVAIAEGPGALVGGEVARLLDRGYQKFIKTSKFEIPASASQLQEVHLFSEELKQLTGGTSFYNESLGTTSDVYEYDRLKGRETEEAAAERSLERTAEG